MAIYFKGGHKYKTLKGLLRGYYWHKQTPSTYLDPDCKILQFENNREKIPSNSFIERRYNRSFDVMLEMAQTYFPETTVKSFIKTLKDITIKSDLEILSFNYTKKFRIIFCPNVRKPVVTSRFLYTVPFITSNPFWDDSDFGALQRGIEDQLNDRVNCMYSMNEIKEMLE